jgi:hypothetical protein
VHNAKDSNLYLLPGVLSGSNVRFAIERNIRKRVTVQELDRPVEQADETSKDAEHNRADNIAVASSRSLGSRADLSDELDDGNEQTTQTNATEAVGQGTLQGTAGRTLGEFLIVRIEVPRAVYTRDGDVNGVFEPSGELSMARLPNHDFWTYSENQYIAKVTKAIRPMTLPLLQPPVPLLHAGLLPGWKFT